MFVQNNWLGPLSHGEAKDLLPQGFSDPEKYKALISHIQTELSCDGESVYELCIGIEYLYMARCILLNCHQHLTGLQTSEWWLIHCINVHQQILDDRSPTLKEKTMELIDSVAKKEALTTDDKNRDLSIQFHLEAGYMCYTYYEYKKADEHFNTAQGLAKLQIELTGVMGKRTRFQEEDKAQLVLSVKRESPMSVSSEENVKTELPKIVKLDDDTILDEIELSEKSQDLCPDLSALEQAVIIGAMENKIRSQASQDKLTEEEAMAYIDCMLSQAKCWSVVVAAVLKRSVLQKTRRRTVERSMMQLEELINQIPNSNIPFTQRSYLFYTVRMKPVWNIQKQLAELFLSIGVVASALEVFERLELWEDAIQCYKTMGKMEKAETVIREQLAIKETPNLWCFLGDVTSEISHYQKAWEMSNHRSARAQRCMGYVYFGQLDYKKSMECFELSLKVNSLQIPVWYVYGCVALAAEDFTTAMKAFKRCVNLETDNFEAWNNLSIAYIKLKDKPKAYVTLKEAIKCNYGNWRLWENLLIIATDVGEFQDSILSYNRLMDLKEKWTDEKALEILVAAVTGGYDDSKGHPASRYSNKLLELFGRITAKVTGSGKIWNLYAKLTTAVKKPSPEVSQMVLQYLQKSHRCDTQDTKWQKDVDKCKNVGEESIRLADTYIQSCEKESSKDQALQMMSSAKLMMKGVITKIKQEHTDVITESVNEAVVPVLESLNSKFQEIMDKITELKGS
ncbi:hypothetical protein FSP39_003620 [Pinctada imbricata]|uniref:Tetratricopeptide repeat protein 27 n=1 Tax=Pinctada imbricata TaxID=66713 RepID=A0AA88XUU7_PINIB|nr:hypothetical protein FSP39_003620 [Pinctada imbricata]